MKITEPQSPPPIVTKPRYFGCLIQSGHRAWDENLRSLDYNDPAWDWLNSHDAVLPPHADGLKHKDGAARFYSWPGRCVVAFWDRTGDSRRNSHSTFLLPGDHTAESALAAARESFPKLFERIKFDIEYPTPEAHQSAEETR